MSNYIIKQCVLCNKDFTVRNIVSKNKKQYCSIACRNTANARKKTRKPNIVCELCGISFYSPRKKTLFCSDSCYRQSSSVFGDNFHNREELIDYICEQYPHADLDQLKKEVGISLTAIRDIANRRDIFRDEASINKQYQIISESMVSNNPMKKQSVVDKVAAYWEKNKDRQREIALNASLSNQKNKPSKPELRMAKILDDLGVIYEHQYIIKDKFIVDFKIGNNILECDGEYWHGHPRFEPLTERQIRQKKRDTSRNKYLFACGYNVIRVWESEITFDNIKKIIESIA